MTQEQERLLEIDLIQRIIHRVNVFEHETEEHGYFPLTYQMVATMEKDNKSDPDYGALFVPIYFPLDCITKQITIKSYNDGKPFVAIDFFEVTDDHNTCPIEQDYGNIKVIALLKSIAENSVYFDIKFLPKWVVDQLTEWHFDTNGLIPQGLAISVFECESNPYA